MDNFWKQLDRPFFALAPMEDVTDTVFRELVASVSSPERLHLLFTEFMSVDGFLHEKGSERVSERLFVSERERQLLDQKEIKLVVQIWGTDPEKFYRAGRRIAREYGFDGIDINMGCPVKKIVRHGACSALIHTPRLAGEIVTATREGSGLPVSVKTRTGIRKVVTGEWIGHLLEVNPAAITLHGRTQKMMSGGDADWNEVAGAVRLRDASGSGTLIIGNGDVTSYSGGLEKAASSRADGVMVGRGIFADPFFFSARSGPDSEYQTPENRIRLLQFHLNRFHEVWGPSRNYAILKRFFKIYLHSFPGASDLRNRLMDTRDAEEGLALAEQFAGSYSEKASIVKKATL